MAIELESIWLKLLGADYWVDPQQQIYWLFLLAALFWAGLFRYFAKTDVRIFDRAVWLCDSSKLDYRYFIVSSAIRVLLLLPLVASAHDIAFLVLKTCHALFGFRMLAMPDKPVLLGLMTISLFVVNDFTRYWLHRLMHGNRWLWELHKVHHSAQMLNPLTFYRVHPLETLLFGLRYAVSAGLVIGLFLYFFGAGLGVWDILGVNALTFVVMLLGANLRHSHIPLRYPLLLEWILISPVQHQWHHTCTGNRHNYGGALSLWDRLFGSWYQPAVQSMQFGLTELTNEYRSITSLLLRPICMIVAREKQNEQGD